MTDNDDNASMTPAQSPEAIGVHTSGTEETAECRGCGKALRGKPYYMGGSAYLPLSEGGGQAKVNFYGGFVCSRSCDYRSSLRLEQTMPGHYRQESLHPCSEAGRRIQAAWGDA